MLYLDSFADANLLYDYVYVHTGMQGLGLFISSSPIIDGRSGHSEITES